VELYRNNEETVIVPSMISKRLIEITDWVLSFTDEQLVKSDEVIDCLFCLMKTIFQPLDVRDC